ncbi:hypothetical protein [Paraferrimonas sedimenticola]|uniref:Uncharacterized protein n=1 Tax=Paraferrimonas sedimenticola TaxID=375674 RepID=A0AA37RV25_9GAMM|nr:hypothetical protein [Paraferrimonas sedimenticola]GLP95062.1 hypothetical protein GCM10007895_03680 [Paraferrimonas sedimenticola]
MIKDLKPEIIFHFEPGTTDLVEPDELCEAEQVALEVELSQFVQNALTDSRREGVRFVTNLIRANTAGIIELTGGYMLEPTEALVEQYLQTQFEGSVMDSEDEDINAKLWDVVAAYQNETLLKRKAERFVQHIQFTFENMRLGQKQSH